MLTYGLLSLINIGYFAGGTMFIILTLILIWAWLMLRSGIAEYNYYQSVKLHEPLVWQQLGSPKYFKIPMLFISPKGVKLLRGITNKAVIECAQKHRVAGIQFFAYIAVVLTVSIIYFKTA